jgi:hypothetical protein
MSKSKLRGGAKAHRKRVQKRNNNIKQQEREIERLREKIYLEAKARYEQQQSGSTEDNIMSDEVNYDVRTGKQFYFKEINND